MQQLFVNYKLAVNEHAEVTDILEFDAPVENPEYPKFVAAVRASHGGKVDMTPYRINCAERTVSGTIADGMISMETRGCSMSRNLRDNVIETLLNVAL